MAQTHDPHGAHGAHAHPDAKTYFQIAVILGLITAAEVAVIYIEPFRPVLIPALLTMSAVKFALVALFYMHLKSDGPLLTGVFGFSLLLATAIILALVILFGYLYAVHPTVNPLK